MTTWTPATAPPVPTIADDDGMHTRDLAVRIDPSDSPEPDALEIIVIGRWWAADEDSPACWRNRLGQELQVIGWRPMAESGEGSVDTPDSAAPPDDILIAAHMACSSIALCAVVAMTKDETALSSTPDSTVKNLKSIATTAYRLRDQVETAMAIASRVAPDARSDR